MRRFVKALTSAALGATVAFAACEPKAEAQEIQLTGPLAGAKAVRKLRLYREGRFEIAPTVSFSLLDEYRRTIIGGARLQYNFTDWLAVGVWGGYGFGFSTDLTDQIDTVAQRNARTAINVNHTATGTAPFGDQVGRISWVAFPQVQFIPFRGKLALFQALFVDADAYVFLGGGAAGLQERPDCGAAGQTSCSNPSSFTLGSRVAPAFTGGIGLNFWLADLVSLGIEYRAMPFSWNRGGFDSRGGPPSGNFPDNKVDSSDQTFKFNQMLSISVGVMLGDRKTSP